MGLMTSMTSSSFRRFRDRSIVYVDKSLLIKDILSDDQNNVFLFTRPRRFGKSMNISMLDAFFNVKYAGNSWFDGLKISDHPECNEYKNKHPVIYMDLKDLNSRTYELYVGSIKGVICKVCCDHEELLQSEAIMILSRKLSDALNEQINMELWSSNLYLSMSVHFNQLGLEGFAHWTLKQSQEELEHAYKMIDYSIKRGGQVTIGVVNSVPTAWGEPLEIFQHIYEHEVHVSGSIDKIVDIASEEKDKATQDFLWGFVREQVEEEATAKNIVEKLKLYGEHHAVLMDHQLGKR